ncbi:MAG: hypothetical protein C0467_05355 [Planctomycetaceae bacterium]|nr:hypothetical protein [Planctomycetaceae bacterium]
MNVGIDLRPLDASQSGGIVPLIEQLTSEVFALAPTHRFIVFTNTGYRLPFALPTHVTMCEVADGSAAFDAGLEGAKTEVLLRAYPTDEPIDFPAAREVTFVPDLLHMDRPDWLPPEVVTRRVVAFGRAMSGGAVLAPSLHAIGRIRAHFPTAHATPLLVTPPPPRLRERFIGSPHSEEAARIPHGPFFIYPARGWPHKNHAVLLRAWSRFHELHPQYTLVLTGTGGRVPELLAASPNSSVRDLGYVSPRLLVELYRRATGLVFPSLHEGYGLPILEAFEIGIPVVCGNSTSLPEVGGDAVLGVDASDDAAIASALERIVAEPDLRTSLVSRGRERLADYDSTAGAKALLKALEDVGARAIPTEQLRVRSSVTAELLATSETQLRLVTQGEETTLDTTRLLSAILRYDRLVTSQTGPLVTVVVTMGDQRGDTARCVRAWTQEQTLPRHKYEVIVAFDGKNWPDLERVKQVLGPLDRVLHVPTDSESEPWAQGATHARGYWLYFAEAHSYGESECLEEMVRYLITEGRPGASSRSLGLGEKLSGRLEEQMFERVSAIRTEDSHWSKLFLRGAAIEREAYLRVGGIQGKYRRFAEPLLAARLHRAGYRLGHARRSIVRHWNTNSFAQLEDHIRDYATSESAFRLYEPEPESEAYFGMPPEWECGGQTDPVLSRMEARVLLQTLIRGQGSVQQLLQDLPACLLGERRWRWPAALKRVLRKIRIHLMSEGTERTNAFAAWWQRAAAGARLDFVTRLDGESIEPRDDVAIDHIPAPLLAHFHPLEQYEGRPFRWSKPVSHIKLALPPGKQVVELRTRELRPKLTLRAFVNGRRVAVEDRSLSEQVIRVTVREEVRRTGLQYLTLTCRPWWFKGDSRRLGFPLFGILRLT